LLLPSHVLIRLRRPALKALRFAHAAFQVAGLTNVVKEFATASNIHQQDQIYKQQVRAVLHYGFAILLSLKQDTLSFPSTQIRPFLTNPILVKILSSPVFLWNALGVPINQANCLLKDGSIQDFVLATFDPIPKMGCLSKGAYHYLLVYPSFSCLLFSLFTH
jgi:betaine lipid synthase